MKTDLMSIFKGRGDKISSMRVGFLLALVVVLTNWSYANYNKKTELVPIPENAVALVVGLAGAKVWQGYSEAKKSDPTPPAS